MTITGDDTGDPGPYKGQPRSQIIFRGTSTQDRAGYRFAGATVAEHVSPACVSECGEDNLKLDARGENREGEARGRSRDFKMIM